MPHTSHSVYAPVLTPFKSDLSLDAETHLRFCRWLLANDVGLAVFGTNSEANSLSVAERIGQLEYLAAAGIPGESLVPGTGTCALPDTLDLTRAALRCRAHAVLMLPPFFFKPVSEDGAFASYAEVIERTGDSNLRIWLYHIPRFTGVPITLPLIERLVKRYPATIVGLKDSGGDIAYTLSVLRAFSQLRVFCGSEAFLTETLQNGGVGCISAGANVNPAAIAAACRDWKLPGAADRQLALNAIRNEFEVRPMIPALKATAARLGNHAGFAATRPPLVPLAAAQSSELAAALTSHGFTMPGLAEALAG